MCTGQIPGGLFGSTFIRESVGVSVKQQLQKKIVPENGRGRNQQWQSQKSQWKAQILKLGSGHSVQQIN